MYITTQYMNIWLFQITKYLCNCLFQNSIEPPRQLNNQIITALKRILVDEHKQQIWRHSHQSYREAQQWTVEDTHSHKRAQSQSPRVRHGQLRHHWRKTSDYNRNTCSLFRQSSDKRDSHLLFCQHLEWCTSRRQLRIRRTEVCVWHKFHLLNTYRKVHDVDLDQDNHTWHQRPTCWNEY